MVLLKKFKAVIINPDRTTDVQIISKKRKLGPNAFYLGKNKSQIKEVYIINPDHTIITTTKRLGIPFNYQTCYYKKNVPTPTPINKMDGGQTKEQLREIINPKTKEREGREVYVNHPIQAPKFEDVKLRFDMISAEELAVLFNPQFYGMIARANKDKKSDQLWMMQVGSLAGIGFIIYYMIQSLPKSLVKAIGAYLGGN